MSIKLDQAIEQYQDYIIFQVSDEAMTIPERYKSASRPWTGLLNGVLTKNLDKNQIPNSGKL